MMILTVGFRILLRENETYNTISDYNISLSVIHLFSNWRVLYFQIIDQCQIIISASNISTKVQRRTYKTQFIGDVRPSKIGKIF